MILDRIQRYLSLAFFTSLVITQALIFVAVSASNNNNQLPVVFVEPSSENIEPSQAFYFQALISQDKLNFDSINFHLVSPALGVDQMYEASLQSDGSYKAQSIFDTSLYPAGAYYLSLRAYDYENDIPVAIYDSLPQLINIAGTYQAAAENVSALPIANFNLPLANSVLNPQVDSKMEIEFFVGDSTANNFNFLSFVIHNSAGSDGQTQEVYASREISGVASADGTEIYSDTVDISNFSDGNYVINISSNLPEINNLSIFFRSFSICRDCDQVVQDLSRVTLDISSPLAGANITSNNLNVIASSSAILPTNYTYLAEMKYRQNGLVFGTYQLATTASNPLIFSTNINLLSQNIPNEDGLAPLNSAYLSGNYDLNIYLVESGGVRRLMDSQIITLSLDTNVSEPVYEISLANLSPISNEDLLDLNFSTSFSASNFQFSLVNLDDPTIALESTIALVGDGTSWSRQISAQEANLTNGRYSLSATASDTLGHNAQLDPITFSWNITQENVAINPDQVTLTVYQPSNGQLGLGGLLLASANILDVEFILRSVGDTNLGHTLTSNYISCSDQTILSQEVRERAALLGHQYCFYSLISDDIAGQIINGNYNFFVQHVGADFTAQSAAVPLTYFNADNQNIEENTGFKVYQLEELSNISGDFNILITSDQSLTKLNVKLKNLDSEGSLDFIVNASSWAKMESFGVRLEDNSARPFAYISEGLDSKLLPNGSYSFLIEGREMLAKITINNETENIEEVENMQDLTTSTASQNSAVSNNKIAIDFYSTCVEQGIDNEQSCLLFRATMDLLDDTCVEQGIYEAVACEDYLYRIRTDLECQENKIIDKEECKNYLLEKYGGQVDCQLEDRNLCDNILRNEYLNRLVAGQRLSQNISRATDSWLGKNISTQELGNILQESGVDSKKVLPLLASQDIKVLVARAQKEVVLEEKDKLTILNQAVLILDTDGDGLSDDLEKYYGTEINNPDTDGDGYNDGLEIKGSFDPLGPGALLKTRTDLDKVLLDDEKKLEQPKIKSKRIDKKMEVENVVASPEAFKLSGKAEPDTWVNIYLYSGLPLVMTTKTDASGNWSYDVKHSISDGHHRVFVTVNDDTGKIVKQSRPISFLIKEAQAVTADNYFDQSSGETAVKNSFIYYILGGAFLVFLALGVIIFLHKGKNRNLEV